MPAEKKLLNVPVIVICIEAVHHNDTARSDSVTCSPFVRHVHSWSTQKRSFGLFSFFLFHLVTSRINKFYLHSFFCSRFHCMLFVLKYLLIWSVNMGAINLKFSLLLRIGNPRTLKISSFPLTFYRFLSCFALVYGRTPFDMYYLIFRPGSRRFFVADNFGLKLSRQKSFRIGWSFLWG